MSGRQKAENPRKKAKDLVELALNDGATDKERLTAMVTLVKLIKKYDLLSSQFDALPDHETIKAATDIFERITDPDLVDAFKKIAGKFKRQRR